MATFEVQVEKVSTVDAVLKLSNDELRQQLDLYGVDTKGLVSRPKPQLQKALIKVNQPVSPVSKTKEEWLLKSKQLEAAHAEADRQLKEKELEVETLKLKQAEQERLDELASEKQERLDRLAAKDKERSDKLELQERRRLDRVEKEEKDRVAKIPVEEKQAARLEQERSDRLAREGKERLDKLAAEEIREARAAQERAEALSLKRDQLEADERKAKEFRRAEEIRLQLE